MLRTFKKGIEPNYRKEITSSLEIKPIAPPQKVAIALKQHAGIPAKPCVKVGDSVSIGQVIGIAGDGLSCNVHASISGTVESIDMRLTFGSIRCEHIVIKNDFSGKKTTLAPLDQPIAEDVIERLRTAGIVGMGGGAFPTYAKYSADNVRIDTLILNGAECEPYITCDHRLMLEHSSEIIAGAKIISRAFDITNLIIGIEDNKLDTLSALRAEDVPVAVLKTKYPQGAEKQLVQVITGKTVPEGCLPRNVGCVVNNVHTMYSAYQALAKGIPLTSRIVTISGQAVKNPGNYIVPIGMSFADVIEAAGGYKATAVKVLNGGPMMGTAVSDLNTHFVTKATSSILFLTEDEINMDMAYPCINCGKCSLACPYKLMPMFIDAYTIGKNYKAAKKYGAINCVECGCCAFTCPAKRPLVQNIRLAKKMIGRYEL